MKTYIAYAINESGARTDIGIDFDHPNGGAEYDTIKEAVDAAKAELSAGWKVLIENSETGEPVKEFYTTD